MSRQSNLEKCVDFLFDDPGESKPLVNKTGKKPKIKTKRVNLVIEPEALDLIREVAIKSGTSVSSFMVMASTEVAKIYKKRHEGI